MKYLTKYIKENESKNNNAFNGFVIIKPGFIKYKKEIENDLSTNGWDIIDSKDIKLSIKQSNDLYLMHKDKDFYNNLCKYMSSDKCICLKCYKDCKDPIKQMNLIKEKIRSKYAINDMKNAMHSSDSIKNVNREAALVFNS